MTIILSIDGLDPAIGHAVDDHERTPTCRACGLEMHRSELRVVRRAVARLGAPARPPLVLPAWTCGGCGHRSPRLVS